MKTENPLKHMFNIYERKNNKEMKKKKYLLVLNADDLVVKRSKIGVNGMDLPVLNDHHKTPSYDLMSTLPNKTVIEGFSLRNKHIKN